MPKYTHFRLKTALLLALLFLTHHNIAFAQTQEKTFNKYLLQAVDTIQKNWSLRGYDIKGVFTHDLNFGNKTLRASRPAATMCVAAQLELIVTALNIYAAEKKDSSVYDYLPTRHWISTQSGTFKDLVWVNSGSQGTAYALNAYGMGELRRYSELLPGSFVNINRNNRTGHAVLFLSYIDGVGNKLDHYSDKVKGFMYYSSQGKGPGVGGYGYRYAFFGTTCPVLSAGKKRDCGLIYSEKQVLLNCGVMLDPSRWDKQKRDAKLEAIKKIHSLGENKVNPKYTVQNTTDD
jgi:hypothetical protein